MRAEVIRFAGEVGDGRASWADRTQGCRARPAPGRKLLDAVNCWPPISSPISRRRSETSRWHHRPSRVGDMPARSTVPGPGRDQRAEGGRSTRWSIRSRLRADGDGGVASEGGDRRKNLGGAAPAFEGSSGRLEGPHRNAKLHGFQPDHPGPGIESLVSGSRTADLLNRDAAVNARGDCRVGERP